MDGTYARCTDTSRKGCRSEVQWVPRPVLGDGEMLVNRCRFCRRKNRLVPIDEEFPEIRDARARLRERRRK